MVIVTVNRGNGVIQTFNVPPGDFTIPQFNYSDDGEYNVTVDVSNGFTTGIDYNATGANSVKLVQIDASQTTGLEQLAAKAADLEDVTLGAIKPSLKALTIQESEQALKIDSAVAGKVDLTGLGSDANVTISKNTGVTNVVLPADGVQSADLSENALTEAAVASLVESAASATNKPEVLAVYGQTPLAPVAASQSGLQSLTAAGREVRADVAVTTFDVTATASQTLQLTTTGSGLMVLQPDIGAATQSVSAGANQATTITYDSTGAKQTKLIQKYDAAMPGSVTSTTFNGAAGTNAQVTRINAAGSGQLQQFFAVSAASVNSINIARRTNIVGAITTDPVTTSALQTATITATGLSGLVASNMPNLMTLAATANTSLADATVANSDALTIVSLATNNLSTADLNGTLAELVANGFAGALTLTGQLTGATIDPTDDNLEILIKRCSPLPAVPSLTGFKAIVNIANNDSVIDASFTIAAATGTININWGDGIGVVSQLITSSPQTITRNYTGALGDKTVTVTGIQGFTALTLNAAGTGSVNKWKTLDASGAVFLTSLTAIGQSLTILNVTNCYPLTAVNVSGNTTLGQASVNNLFINLNTNGFLVGTVVTTGVVAQPTDTGLDAKNALTVGLPSPPNKNWSITL